MHDTDYKYLIIQFLNSYLGPSPSHACLQIHSPQWQATMLLDGQKCRPYLAIRTLSATALRLRMLTHFSWTPRLRRLNTRAAKHMTFLSQSYTGMFACSLIQSNLLHWESFRVTATTTTKQPMYYSLQTDSDFILCKKQGFIKPMP